MDFDSYKNSWLSLPEAQRRVDFDHTFDYQCVDLIMDGIYKMHKLVKTIPWGNAIAYWYHTNHELLSKFYRVAGSEAQKGDIVILETNKTPVVLGAGEGHIGWSTGNINATDVEILEQNGHGGLSPNKSGDGVGQNAIRTRWVKRNRVAGLLRPINVPQPPAPAPPPPKPVVHPYRIEPITPKVIEITANTQKWGLNYDNWPAIKNNPITPATIGQRYTVVARLHHNLGGEYYLPDANVAQGFNTADCKDYVAPPSAPIPIPTSTEPYEIVKPVPGYTTANNALNRADQATTVRPSLPNSERVWYKFNEKYGMINVTAKPGLAGAWINPADNVIVKRELSPVPAPVPQSTPVVDAVTAVPVVSAEPEVPSVNSWKSSNQRILPDGESVLFVADIAEPITIYDLDNKQKPLIMRPYTEIHIVSTFVKDGVTYGRPSKVAEKFWWYGVPMQVLKTYDEIYDIENSLATRAFMKTTKPSDWPALILARIGRLIQDVKKY